jgi:hypothetical protein
MDVAVEADPGAFLDRLVIRLGDLAAERAPASGGATAPG